MVRITHNGMHWVGTEQLDDSTYCICVDGSLHRSRAVKQILAAVATERKRRHLEPDLSAIHDRVIHPERRERIADWALCSACWLGFAAAAGWLADGVLRAIGA